MMQCGTCNHWVHAKCEDLTGNYYFLLNLNVWVSVNTFAIAKVIYLAINKKKAVSKQLWVMKQNPHLRSTENI